MSHSYISLHYHFVFSTKHREPTLTPDLCPRLYDYIGGIVRATGGVLLAAGGIADHVHLLAGLAQQPAIADVLRLVKTNSSKWVRETFPDIGWAGWQTGYGAFTVSYSGLDRVRAYIADQERHHRVATYQDELRALIAKTSGGVRRAVSVGWD